MILAVEAVRACPRAGRDHVAQAEQGLALVSLIPLTDAIIARAQQVGLPMLRSLDAPFIWHRPPAWGIPLG